MEKTNFKRPAKARQHRTHEQRLARDLANGVRSDWGPAWSRLSHHARTSEAARALISVISARVESSPDVAALFECWLQINEDLGLNEED